ncbi:cytochrome P450 2D15-like isoform X1 [Rhineura floridana]|uniref:cytochrome P450 2D15-like isoform X1 n=1 Tax=Rhineura floridana TaxID=261503 RepID=UPI002AC7F348|nr:cytochrome P450 2D15-like isoform X1 [Rhineura floridana]
MQEVPWLWTLIIFCWNNFTILIVFLILFVLLLDHVKRRTSWSHYPPGPSGLPFLGNLLQFDINNIFEDIEQKRKEFGAAFSVQLGWTNIVVLNGYELIRETFGPKSDVYLDRLLIPFLHTLGYARKKEGLFFASYSRGWKEQKKFLHLTWKRFGVGKKSLEQNITEEAQYLCSEFEQKEGNPFNPQILLANAVNNVICILTFGERFNYSDEKFLKLMQLTDELLKTVNSILFQVVSMIPGMSYISRGPHCKVVKCYQEIQVMLREIVNEHKDSRDPAFARDFIDAFLEETEKTKGDPDTSFNEDNLLILNVELFIGGTLSTAATLQWGLLFMVLYPDIQKKVHKEIDMVLGRNKWPITENQANMHYTNAVVHEIHRYADITPLTIPYLMRKDTEILGFFLPKKTLVVPNLSSVLKDETMWEKPFQFYPEHFLDADGHFVKQEAFLPFSLGHRTCPGEQLTRMEIFIFFTSLLQNFTFCIPDGQPRPQEDSEYNLARFPHAFEICAISR